MIYGLPGHISCVTARLIVVHSITVAVMKDGLGGQGYWKINGTIKKSMGLEQ